MRNRSTVHLNDPTEDQKTLSIISSWKWMIFLYCVISQYWCVYRRSSASDLASQALLRQCASLYASESLGRSHMTVTGYPSWCSTSTNQLWESFWFHHFHAKSIYQHTLFLLFRMVCCALTPALADLRCMVLAPGIFAQGVLATIHQSMHLGCNPCMMNMRSQERSSE